MYLPGLIYCKSRKVKFTKGKHGGYRIIPVKRNDIEHVSEKEFIERIKNEYDTWKTIVQILNNLSLDFVKKLSKYFSTKDITNYS